MAECEVTPTYQGPNTVRLDWTATTGTYYVYVDGLLDGITTQTYYFVRIVAGSSISVEVQDDLTAPAAAYPSHFRFGIQTDQTATSYLIEKETEPDVWTEQISLPNNIAYYVAWDTGILEDDTEHVYRVTPIAANAGTAQEFRALMVRRPDAPVATIAYADGVLTAS